MRLVGAPIGGHDAGRIGRGRLEMNGLAERTRKRPVRVEDPDEVRADELLASISADRKSKE